MWIVKLALRRPYTLAVVAILLAVLGGISIQRTPTDELDRAGVPNGRVHIDSFGV